MIVLEVSKKSGLQTDGPTKPLLLYRSMGNCILKVETPRRDGVKAIKIIVAVLVAVSSAVAVAVAEADAAWRFKSPSA